MLYRNAIRQILFAQENLTVFQDAVDDIELVGETVTGVRTATGIRFSAPACVLPQVLFEWKDSIGMENQSGGRMGDAAVVTLADRLRELCPRTGRLKLAHHHELMAIQWTFPFLKNNGETSQGQ